MGLGRMRDFICGIFYLNQSRCSMYQRDVDRYLHQSLDALSMCIVAFVCMPGGLFFHLLSCFASGFLCRLLKKE